MRFPHPNGFGFYQVFTDIIAGLLFIICLVVAVGLIVLLVRFLLVATRAAELYVANNRATAVVPPTETATVPEPVVTTPVATTPAATTPVATTKPVTPAPRTRAPKPPTTPPPA